jgi:SAM-dependent methyltransferase
MPSLSPSLSKVLLCGLSLLSAFLLFQVQPVLSKYILPWFGGSPGVWTTCMLFFQIVLFLGYAYAHGLTRLSLRTQLIVHSGVVLAALCMLPIAPSESWRPAGDEDPVGRILGLLFGTIALPYFALSSTSPLVQVWFARRHAGSNPWRLYALSNLGSLVALLSYPFIIEPAMDVQAQTTVWSVAFALYAVLSLLAVRLGSQAGANTESVAAVKDDDDAGVAPTWLRRLLWVALPGLASATLLAATNHLCQDVAVIPFLWVAPLSLYLITFIICFEHDRWFKPLLWALPAIVFIFLAGGLEPFHGWLSTKGAEALTPPWPELPGLLAKRLDALDDTFTGQLVIGLGAVFLACMMCHGQLARLKPGAKWLTEFYLLMSAGGALGGLVVSLVAPLFFSSYLEWPVLLTINYFLAIVVGLLALRPWLRRWPTAIPLAWVTLLLAIGGYWLLTWGFDLEDRVERVRNFYGSVSIEKAWDEEAGADRMTLHHGGIIHGYQFQTHDMKELPLSYYGEHTGVGLALSRLAKRPSAKVGIVGMGTATAAVYAQRGHTFRFYEINPAVVRLARQHFSYQADAETRGATIEVALADARLALQREPDQGFDVLLLDAFSGDSVPVHLLTREALDLYRRHMKPDGIIAVHVSNRYLSLAPMVEATGRAAGYSTSRVVTGEEGYYEYTDYVLLGKEGDVSTVIERDDEAGSANLKVRPWTDQDHNLFEILDVSE